MTTDETPEIVLTGVDKKEVECYDDSSDESECSMPKLLARRGDDSSVDSDECTDESHEEIGWIEEKRSRWVKN